VNEELQGTIDPNPEWYKNLQYKDVKVFIQDNINSASRSFVAIGYYLKYVRDNELFKRDDYQNIWEFAKGEFGIGKSSASQFMSINDKFSKDGNSPILLDQYKDFSSSKLAEMLTLSDEQLEQVTIATTRAEIREMKQPTKEIETVLHAEQRPECFIRDQINETGEEGLKCSAGISEECDNCDKSEPEGLSRDQLGAIGKHDKAKEILDHLMSEEWCSLVIWRRFLEEDITKKGKEEACKDFLSFHGNHGQTLPAENGHPKFRFMLHGSHGNAPGKVEIQWDNDKAEMPTDEFMDLYLKYPVYDDKKPDGTSLPEDNADESEPEESGLIDDLDLSVRTYNCLKRAGINTIEKLCSMTLDEVTQIHNLAPKCVAEVQEKLAGVGRVLKGQPKKSNWELGVFEDDNAGYGWMRSQTVDQFFDMLHGKHLSPADIGSRTDSFEVFAYTYFAERQEDYIAFENADSGKDFKVAYQRVVNEFERFKENHPVPDDIPASMDNATGIVDNQPETMNDSDVIDPEEEALIFDFWEGKPVVKQCSSCNYNTMTPEEFKMIDHDGGLPCNDCDDRLCNWIPGATSKYNKSVVKQDETVESTETVTEEESFPCDTCGHDINGCCNYEDDSDWCELGSAWIPKAGESEQVETVEAEIIQTEPEYDFDRISKYGLPDIKSLIHDHRKNMEAYKECQLDAPVVRREKMQLDALELLEKMLSIPDPLEDIDEQYTIADVQEELGKLTVYVDTYRRNNDTMPGRRKARMRLDAISLLLKEMEGKQA